MSNAARKQQAQQNVAKKQVLTLKEKPATPLSRTKPIPPELIKTDEDKAAEKAAKQAQLDERTKIRGPSIRNLVQTMLRAGKSTDEISSALRDQFPGTKAAEKSRKHISHYRSRMRQDGEEVAQDASAGKAGKGSALLTTIDVKAKAGDATPK